MTTKCLLDGLDTNLLEGADYLISPLESATSVTTLPAQWVSSEYDHKWQATDPNLEQDGHFKGTDAIYKSSNHGAFFKSSMNDLASP